MNTFFNESGEYKKTFIGSGVGMGSMQVLHGFEFEVKPLGDHTFEVKPQENVDQRAGHSILLLEGSLSGDYDVKKNGKCSCIYAVGSQEYQMVCTRPDIASIDVGMLDGFDRGLQTYVQVFVNFDYAMGRSITRYGFMILGCAGSLKANLQHMEALSTTKGGYITFTEAWKKKIWLKRLLEELGVKLNRVLRML
uniref:Zinc finger, CCHC-type n=1 Tax=Tanacetum cinerariifolium TaxID=118510 RepID=A0A699JUB6_TANCI|nr:zinc finger, CCHC-type [Tanacetum cinerariifolium]